MPDVATSVESKWSEVVKRMEQYIESADFVSLSPEEGASILQYLQKQGG